MWNCEPGLCSIAYISLEPVVGQAGRQNDIKWKQNHKYGGYNGSFLNMLHKWYGGLEKNSMNVLPFNVYM